MFEITTESGAVYLWDRDNDRVMRLSGPEVRNQRENDGVWVNSPPSAEPREGAPVMWIGATSARLTTPVTSIKEVAGV